MDNSMSSPFENPITAKVDSPNMDTKICCYDNDNTPAMDTTVDSQLMQKWMPN